MGGNVFKPTLSKHEPQSHTPEHAIKELNLTIVGLTLLMQHGKEQQLNRLSSCG